MLYILTQDYKTTIFTMSKNIKQEQNSGTNNLINTCLKTTNFLELKKNKIRNPMIDLIAIIH